MFSLFDELKRKRMVDTVTFNCILNYCRSLEEMMEHYHLMKEMNVQPCEKTYKTLIFRLTRRSVITNKALTCHVNTILADLLLHAHINSDTVTSFLLKCLSRFDSSEVAQAVKCVEKYRAGEPENCLSAPSLFLLL